MRTEADWMRPKIDSRDQPCRNLKGRIKSPIVDLRLLGQRQTGLCKLVPCSNSSLKVTSNAYPGVYNRHANTEYSSHIKPTWKKGAPDKSSALSPMMSITKTQVET